MTVEAAAAASAVAAKSAGGAAMLGAGAGVAAGLSMLVVMLTKRPRTDQEWLVAIISTVVSSLCGGAVVIESGLGKVGQRVRANYESKTNGI